MTYHLPGSERSSARNASYGSSSSSLVVVVGVLVGLGVLVAVHVGAVVGRDLVGSVGGGLGLLLGDGVVEHLGGGLGLGCFVKIQRVVHDRVRLRVVDVDVVQVGEVLVVAVVHDVDGERARRVRRNALPRPGRCPPGLRRPRRTAQRPSPSRRRRHIFQTLRSLPFRRRPASCRHRASRAQVGCYAPGWDAEDEGRHPDEQQVESVDDRHHDDHEAQHDTACTSAVPAGWG